MIKSGDVIVGVDDVPTLRNSELLEQLGRHRPGDVVTIKYERDGKMRSATARLQNTKGTTEVVRLEPEPESIMELGAEFVELDEETAESLDLSGGVTVADVKSGMIAEQTRIRPGFVITKVNGRSVRSVTDFQKMLASSDNTISLEGIYPNDPERAVKKYGIYK